MNVKHSAITYLLGISTIALAIVAYKQYKDNAKLVAELGELRSRIGHYEERDGNSFVVERISKQMEDIAYQQMDISNKRREEALFQMRLADEMRSRAESEQRKAQEFARNVVEARNMAEQQRELAVEQQHKAEHSRNVADTLSYIALGRSLASLSSTQYLAGNKDASSLLAYTAWKFTHDYKGNVNIPVIFKALSQNSGSFTSSLIHKGGVSSICPLNKKGDFVSVSRYGEITQWNYNSGKWNKKLLASDSNCSYRDVCIGNDGVIYAISYNGVLQSVANSLVSQPIILPEGKGWSRVCPFSADKLLLVSASCIHVFNTTTRTIVNTIQVPQEISAVGMKDDRLLVFGQKGGSWSLGKDEQLNNENLNIRGTVTAFTWHQSKQLAAAGLENGDIFILDANGNSRGKLVNHGSRITDLQYMENFLFSSSYDRVVNIWNVNATNGEALSINDFNSWIYCMCSTDSKSIYVGDESGRVSRIVVSASEMAAKIHSNLRRDFTDDEWAYYVGENVPRIKLKQ